MNSDPLTGAVSLSKSETKRFTEAIAIARGVKHIAGPEHAEAIDKCLAGCDYIARNFGHKHLDENGELKEPDSRKREESEAPQQPASAPPESPQAPEPSADDQRRATSPAPEGDGGASGGALFDNSDPLKNVGGAGY